jgi:hypothetical protein
MCTTRIVTQCAHPAGILSEVPDLPYEKPKNIPQLTQLYMTHQTSDSDVDVHHGLLFVLFCTGPECTQSGSLA